MVSRQIHKVEKIRDRETIFLDHYAWLLDWALRLGRGSKEEAEDLVQDLYVRFVQSKAELDATNEDGLRGYLYKTLRNLSISNGLSGGTDALSNLRAVDYDSVAFALFAIDRSQLLFVRSDLADICEYVRIRRSTSRAASVLLLRFFLGYYPSEIVLLLQTTPSAVNKLIETARLEAKAFLTRPDSLYFMGQSPRKASPSMQYLPDDPAALFVELRRRIFSQTEGEHATQSDMEDRYTSHSKQQVPIQELAHLVSCSTCLEMANRILQLTSLSQRFPGDSNGRNDDSPPPPGIDNRTVPQLRKKLRDTYEHRPNDLQVAVNGEIRGAQLVTSTHSNFQIKLKPLSHPEFIEILSEQGLRLLYLDLDSTDISDPSLKHAEVELSDERSLAVEVSLSSGAPVVAVSYYDPLLEEKDHAWAFDQELKSFHPEQYASQPVGIKTRLVDKLRKKFLYRRPTNFWRWPMILAVVGVLTLFVVNFNVHKKSMHRVPALPTAVTLLSQSKQASDLAIPPHGASRQTFAFEVRSDKGKLIESGRVETLRSQTPHRSATRLLSAQGKLVAGEWIDGRGKGTTYSSNRGIQHLPNTQAPQLTFDDAWMHFPDATDFEQISGDTSSLSVQRDSRGYDLVYGQPAASAATLVSAHLIMAADTMRPVSETLRVRDGRETREYRFTELTYDIVPASQLQESDFDPEPALVDLHSGLSGVPSFDGRATHLTLEALELLSNLGPDTERLIDVERRSDGSVELNGVFPTSQQKATAMRVFQSLQGGKMLKLALHASDEVADSVGPHKVLKVESLEPVAIETQHIPFDAELRSALSAQGLSGSDLNSLIREIAGTATSHVAQLHREAWSIWQIASNDFSGTELGLMPPDDKILWLTLLDKHIRFFDQQLEALTAELEPLVHDEGTRLTSPPTTGLSLHDANELSAVAKRLNHDSDRLDRLLSAGFTLSPSGLSTNHNVAEIAELLADLRIQESMLHETVGRLQAARH